MRFPALPVDAKFFHIVVSSNSALVLNSGIIRLLSTSARQSKLWWVILSTISGPSSLNSVVNAVAKSDGERVRLWKSPSTLDSMLKRTGEEVAHETKEKSSGRVESLVPTRRGDRRGGGQFWAGEQRREVVEEERERRTRHGHLQREPIESL